MFECLQIKMGSKKKKTNTSFPKFHILTLKWKNKIKSMLSEDYVMINKLTKFNWIEETTKQLFNIHVKKEKKSIQ
jgi:hypothetical protein